MVSGRSLNFTPQLLKNLEHFRIHCRKKYFGRRQGGHISLRRGHGMEFSDYRKYELGDSLRHIDWGVYARTDKLYVKRFQEEENLSVSIIIDPSASMVEPTEDKKFERALSIALAISYLGLIEGEEVIVSVPEVYESPVCKGPQAFNYITNEMSNISSDRVGGVDIVRAIKKSLSRVKFPGVLVFISDLLFDVSEVEQILGEFCARNLDATTVHLLGPNDIDPFPGNSILAVDSETGAEVALNMTEDTRGRYSKILSEHIRDVREICQRHGVSYVLTDTEAEISEFLFEGLAKVGFLA